MKKLIIILFASFLGMSAFIDPLVPEPSITGTIEPADGARKVVAIMGTDSVSIVPIGGKFALVTKPGNWNLYIEAIAPYKNTVVENILVLEGGPTDAGVIKLSVK